MAAIRAARIAAGRCSKCDAPALDGILYCATHRRRRNEYQAERRQEHNANGLCVRCGYLSPARPGHTLCSRHIVMDREEARREYAGKLVRARRRRALRRRAGLCPLCGAQPKPGGTMCDRHAAKSRADSRRHRALQRRRRYYHKRRLWLAAKRSLGLCLYCDRAVDDNVQSRSTTFCDAHAAKNTARATATFHRRRTSGLCVDCGTITTHGQMRCPEHAARHVQYVIRRRARENAKSSGVPLALVSQRAHSVAHEDDDEATGTADDDGEPAGPVDRGDDNGGEDPVRGGG